MREIEDMTVFLCLGPKLLKACASASGRGGAERWGRGLGEYQAQKDAGMVRKSSQKRLPTASSTHKVVICRRKGRDLGVKYLMGAESLINAAKSWAS